MKVGLCLNFQMTNCSLTPGNSQVRKGDPAPPALPIKEIHKATGPDLPYLKICGG